MKCKKCGQELEITAKFCPICGEPTQVVCPQCGNKIDRQNKFCSVCGTKLQDSIQKNEKSVDEANTMETQNMTATKTKKKKRKKWWLIPIAVLVIVVGLFLNVDYKESEVVVSKIEMSEIYWGNVTVTLTFDNLSDSPIKNIEFIFMAWDENQLPVMVPDNMVYAAEPYCQENFYEAVNIGAGERKDISFDVWNEIEKLKYVMPVVVSYTSYDGTVWENPEVDSLKKLGGNQLKNLDNVFEMKTKN